jgi:uncharacterized protein (TIGR00251 family)
MTCTITQHGDELWFAIRVQPRASRSAIVGLSDGVLKIAITAAPVDGEANEAVCVFLAKKLGVAKRCVRVVHGDRGRDKTIAVQSVSRASLEALAPHER